MTHFQAAIHFGQFGFEIGIRNYQVLNKSRRKLYIHVRNL